MTELPRTVKTLIKRLGAGWIYRITPGTGHFAESYYGAQRGNGTRPTLHRRRPCASLALRARCADGRAAVGVWVRPDGEPYRFDTAFRWTVCRDEACRYAGTDHPGEMPTVIKSPALAMWLAAGASSDLTISTNGPTDVRSAA